jgi:hypothetical protein
MAHPLKDEKVSIYSIEPFQYFWRSVWGISFALFTQMAEAAERLAHKPFVNDGILIIDMQREPL